MPKFPNFGSIGPVEVEGDISTGYKLPVEATLAPAEVPTSTIVYDQRIVTTSDSEIVATNTNRVSLKIYNDHATGIVWLNFNDETPAVNASYPLLAKQVYEYDSSSNGRFTGTIRAVVAPATSLATLHILEETAV